MAKSSAKTTATTRRRGWNYPRKGLGPVRRWLPSWRVVVGTIVACLALGIGVFAAAWFTTDVPEPEELALAESTTVYYSDGETALGTLAEVNRTIIDTTTLPDWVGNAVVASEDRRFYSNSGVDIVGIARAFWNNLTSEDTQGGSTLTQQYVENYYLGTTTTYMGKFQEAIIALKVEQTMSKEEILDAYLNTIYFGRGAYGIEAAAQAYYGKPAAELTLSESALIAGIIPAPSAWDPAVNAEQAEQRWNHVLGAMVETEMITQAERDEQTFPTTIDPARSDRFGGPTGYLLAMAVEELTVGDDAPFTEDELNREGLSIITTFDAQMQAAAVETIEQDLPEGHDPNLKATLVSVDPATGGIRALYGGTDYLTEGLNRATQAVYQGGSTFKPFTLIGALEQGIPLEQTYESYTGMDVDGYVVNNYDRRDRGRIDLVEATAYSVNSVYVQLNVDATPPGEAVGQETVDTAVRAGLPADTVGLEALPSNVLGNASPHAVDMARVFSTYAAGGERHETHVIEQVLNSDGTILYSGTSPGEQVFDSQIIADATYAMTQVAERGTASQVSALGRPVAGKTGSSNDYKSASFAGFIPQLTTVVAMYQQGEDGSEQPITAFGGYDPVAGGTIPADMWLAYMQKVTVDMEVLEFPQRSAPSTPTGTPTPEMAELPDVTGLDEAAAIAAIEEAGFTTSVLTEFSDWVPVGIVIRTEPGAGEAEEGSAITIVISDGPDPGAEPTDEPTPTPTPSRTPTPSPTEIFPDPDQPEPTTEPDQPEPTFEPTEGGTAEGFGPSGENAAGGESGEAATAEPGSAEAEGSGGESEGDDGQVG